MTSSASIDGKQYLEQNRILVDQLLDRFTPSPDSDPRSIHAAMRYSLMAGGKRIRPILCLAAYEYSARGRVGNLENVHRAMAGLEMVHTYSLIHDDLPCMDDDDLRRGIPTCHKKFGEGIAVLAGDALHVIAFQLMAETGNPSVVLELGQAVGTQGMIGGQVADIEAEGKQVSQADVIYIHTRKTGALIRGAVRIGALLGSADSTTLRRLTIYGEKIGLAFQIIDDILDVEGDQRKLGKQTGSDSKNLKATYPGAAGMEQARRDAGRLIDESLALFENEENALTYLARYIGQREQ